MSNIIVSIDPGIANLGISFIDGDLTKALYYNTIVADSKNHEERLLKIYKDMVEMCKKYKPTILVFEDNQALRGNVGVQIQQALGVCKLAIKQSIGSKELKVAQVTPLAVKKIATGDSKASKSDMEIAAKRIYKLKEIPKTNHEADSLNIGYWYIKTYKLDN